MTEFDYLPSRFYSYDFLSEKLIKMRVFSGKELPMLSKAISTDKYSYLVDALTSSIVCGDDTPFDASNLTIGDFYYLLAWQRLNSYTNNKMVAVWQCSGELFANQDTGDVYTSQELSELPNSMMETLVKAVPCGHINHYNVTFDDIDTITLPEELTLDTRLCLPTAGLIDQINEAVSDENTAYIAPAASWIKEGDTIEDKIAILLAQDTMELFDIASEANATIIHGVSTTISKPCERCGKLADSKLFITPESFFWV